MRARAKRINPILGALIGMTATQTEIGNIIHFRKVSRVGDNDRLGGSTRRLKNILIIYDALLASPGIWFTVKDIARVSGLSVRHSRRMIAQFNFIQHRHIEVFYGVRTIRQSSRIRYAPTPRAAK